MVEILTEKEFEAQWKENIHQGETTYHPEGSTFGVYRYPNWWLIQGSFWEGELRPGMVLTMFDDRYDRTFHMKLQHREDDDTLVAKFYLSGTHRVLSPNIQGVKADYLEQSGQNYLLCLPGMPEVEIYPAQPRLKYVRVFLEPNAFRSLYAQDLASLPLVVRKLFEGNSIQRFHQSLGKTTPGMQFVLKQMLNCRFQGMTKRIYLEGKVLELLALQFAQWLKNETLLPSISPLKTDEIERLYQAEELLIRDLTNPPSLLELARQVGLNDRKLKQGFRQVFNTTVFGYLYVHRMEQAQQLLMETQMTIAAIAHTVGYKNAGDFSAAFGRKFGVCPKAYRQQSV